MFINRLPNWTHDIIPEQNWPSKEVPKATKDYRVKQQRS